MRDVYSSLDVTAASPGDVSTGKSAACFPLLISPSWRTLPILRHIGIITPGPSPWRRGINWIINLVSNGQCPKMVTVDLVDYLYVYIYFSCNWL